MGYIVGESDQVTGAPNMSAAGALQQLKSPRLPKYCSGKKARKKRFLLEASDEHLFLPSR